MVKKAITEINKDDKLLTYLAGLYHLKFINKITKDTRLPFQFYYGIDQIHYRMLTDIQRAELLEFLKANKIIYGVDSASDIMFYANPEEVEQ